jgi:thermitase
MHVQARINKLTMIGIVLLWLLPVSVYGGTAQAKNDPDHVLGQIVVRLEEGENIEDINQTYNTVTIAELVPGRGVYLLQAPIGSDIDHILDILQDDPRILYAEPNLVAEAPEAIRSKDWAWGGEDPEPYGEQYALTSINLAGAHSYSTGADIIVAVVDTGVQLDHPALAARITSVQADFVDGDGAANDEPNGRDDDGDRQIDESTGHGTHVAGIALLVAPDAWIMPVRVLDSDGSGNVFAVAEGILFAAENGAHVINLSLGTTEESDLLEDVIEEAAEEGVLVIAAAGNLGSRQETYPAADECALAITSVGPTDVKSKFANYGTWVDLAAPGESIYSAFPSDGYAWWSGTSMAAPFAAGQAALLRSYDPSLELEDVAELMGGTAQSLASANSRLTSRNWLGAGKIDVAASLESLAAGVIPDSRELLDDDCEDD